MSCDFNDKKIDLETSTGGNYEQYNINTKNKFYNDFVNNKVYRNGRKISAGNNEHEIEECYNHLTSKGAIDNARYPDLRRFEAIYILKDILTNDKCNKCSNYYVWEKEEKYLKEKIFCPDVNYLIILAKRKYVYKIVSAYIIESKSKSSKLIAEYEKCKNK